MPFWNFISGSYVCLIFVIGVTFCIGLPNFVKIELPLAELWRHIDFFKMASGSHIGFDLDNIRPNTKCNCWSKVCPQIWSWSEILRLLYFAVLACNCLFQTIFWGEGLTSPIVLTPKRHFVTRKHVVWAIKRENSFSGSTWERSRGKRTVQDRTG